MAKEVDAKSGEEKPGREEGLIAKLTAALDAVTERLGSVEGKLEKSEEKSEERGKELDKLSKFLWGEDDPPKEKPDE